MDTTKKRAEKKLLEIKSQIQKINSKIERYMLEIKESNSEKTRLQQQLLLLNEIIGTDKEEGNMDYINNSTVESTPSIQGELMTDKILFLLQQYGDMISADIVKRLGVPNKNDKFSVHNAIKKLIREKKIRHVDLFKSDGEKQKRNVPLAINF